MLNQTYKNLEIILINDGSTDNSEDIIKEYAKKDERIIYFSQKNKGLGATRNIGIKFANFDYITFVDSDDELPLDAIENHIKNIQKTNCDISFGNILQVYEDKEVVAEEKISQDLFRDVLCLDADISPCNKIYKKTLFIDNDIIFCENMFFEEILPVIQLFHYAKNISYFDFIVYKYYCANGDSITSGINYKYFEDILIVFDLIYDFLEKKYIANKYIKDFIILVIRYLQFVFTSCIDSLPNKNFVFSVNKQKEYFSDKHFKSFYLENPNYYTMFINNFLRFLKFNNDINTEEIANYMPFYFDDVNLMKKLYSMNADIKTDYTKIIINAIANTNHKEIIITPASHFLTTVGNLLEKENIKIAYAIDKKAQEQEFELAGYKVKSKSSLLNKKSNLPIVITSLSFADEIVKDLENYKKENALENEIYDLHRCLQIISN